jgi:hypothetical protein
MDPQLFDPIYNDDDVPKFNPLLASGLATTYIAGAPMYIDKVFRCAEKDFPAGLEYGGFEMCTPMEAYQEITRRKKNRRQYETAQSSVYMVKYNLRWKGVDLPPRYMFMPIASYAGLMHIRGALYAISPVVTDKAISVGVNNIFIPLTRAKLKFERTMHHFMKNDERTSEYVIWSPVYRRTKPQHGAPKPVVKAFSTLGHYLFCKYGVGETFSKFGNANVEVGYADTVNETTHPESEWFICRSTQLKPVPLGRVAYIGSEIRLAIRKSEWTPMTVGLIAAFFYVVDFFPHRVTPEDVNESRLWRALLAHIIIATTESEGVLVNAVDVHMASLDTYIDALAAEDLQSEGLVINDFYELIAELVESFPRRILESSGSVSSMYGKQLRILRYVCLPIVKDIFNFVFELRKKTKPNMTGDEIVKIMNRQFKTERIMKISYDHGEVRPVSSASDNPVFGITCNVVLQTSSTGATTKAKSTALDPSSYLDASIAEISGYLNLPKSEPSGRSRINPFAAISESGVTIRKKHLIKVIDDAQATIRR